MPLKIVRNDITKMKVDAIVNSANYSMEDGDGVNGAIHRAAGPELLAKCRTLGTCSTGDAKITKGYRLSAKYIIHTVGPVWIDGTRGEREKLISCYQKSLALAEKASCETVAFPLISSGVYRYPKAQALRVAVDTIGEFLMEHDMTVYIVIFDRRSYEIGAELFQDIEEYIDDKYVDEHVDRRAESRRRNRLPEDSEPDSRMPNGIRRLPPQGQAISKTNGIAASRANAVPQTDASAPADHFGSSALGKRPGKTDVGSMGQLEVDAAFQSSLDDAVREIDESFSEMLLRKIDEEGLTDAQVYKKANIDRKLFSKIRSDRFYRPSKPTVLAFAIALELPLDETKEMLMKAGFALSHAYKFDIIIEYFIQHGNYNIFEINEALFAFDQSLLGM